MKLGKYSWGIGDRFARQGEALLKALLLARESGIQITPVWNKSNREHLTIGSVPLTTREAADAAVAELNWSFPYFVDADHINLNTIDRFLKIADFYTIDVADYIGQKGDRIDVDAFIHKNKRLTGEITIPGINKAFNISLDFLNEIGEKYIHAIKQAATIYQYIRKNKTGEFVTEVSMDEVDQPQTPIKLYFILGLLAEYKVPVQTIAPKFTGRFNKGVDYAGNINQFAHEFEDDLLVIDYAIKQFGLPEDMKLSVHSGSDKFSIYPVMGEMLKKHNKGIHIKTAGTTWLEEIIGLSLAGGQALSFVKEIYKKAFYNMEDLCKPYSTVINIQNNQLPSPDEVADWDNQRMAETLRHVPENPNYNPHMRQLIHVAYKLAAEKHDEYIHLLNKHEALIGQQVTENIWSRHIKRLFNL